MILVDASGALISTVQQFSDLEIGLADASLVMLSRRWKTLELLTLDGDISERSVARPTDPFAFFLRTRDSAAAKKLRKKGDCPLFSHSYGKRLATP